MVAMRVTSFFVRSGTNQPTRAVCSRGEAGRRGGDERGGYCNTVPLHFRRILSPLIILQYSHAPPYRSSMPEPEIARPLDAARLASVVVHDGAGASITMDTLLRGKRSLVLVLRHCL